MAKYVDKGLGDEGAGAVPHGQHAYEVAQGYPPSRSVVRELPSLNDALAVAVEAMGTPAYVWRSDSDEAWAGPPALWAQWP